MNQHNIVTLTMPITYYAYEIGDLIDFDGTQIDVDLSKIEDKPLSGNPIKEGKNEFEFK